MSKALRELLNEMLKPAPRPEPGPEPEGRMNALFRAVTQRDEEDAYAEMYRRQLRQTRRK